MGTSHWQHSHKPHACNRTPGSVRDSRRQTQATTKTLNYQAGPSFIMSIIIIIIIIIKIIVVIYL